MKTLVLYDSLGGNTKKVADTIYQTLNNHYEEVDFIKVSTDLEIDFFDYDLVFLGSPVIDWLPTKKLMDFLKSKLKGYSEKGLILPSSPIKLNKYAICYCTFGGPHIGENEAIPMTLWLRSFLEHLGFQVLNQWHFVGQFHKETNMNTNGRLGNILGRPNDKDLQEVENRTMGIVESLYPLFNYSDAVSE